MLSLPILCLQPEYHSKGSGRKDYQFPIPDVYIEEALDMIMAYAQCPRRGLHSSKYCPFCPVTSTYIMFASGSGCIIQVGGQ